MGNGSSTKLLAQCWKSGSHKTWQTRKTIDVKCLHYWSMFGRYQEGANGQVTKQRLLRFTPRHTRIGRSVIGMLAFQIQIKCNSNRREGDIIQCGAKASDCDHISDTG